jgi:hypothetical protein
MIAGLDGLLGHARNMEIGRSPVMRPCAFPETLSRAETTFAAIPMAKVLNSGWRIGQIRAALSGDLPMTCTRLHRPQGSGLNQIQRF